MTIRKNENQSQVLWLAAKPLVAADLASALMRQGLALHHDATFHPRGLTVVSARPQRAAIDELLADEQQNQSWPEAPSDAIWARVFDTTLLTLGVELLVINDDDASGQLAVLASVRSELGMAVRVQDPLAALVESPHPGITIQPRPGWQNYGHPALVARYGRAPAPVRRRPPQSKAP